MDRSPSEQSFFSIDLEFNQPSQNVIQVGVCVGGAMQSEEEYLIRKWYIAPGEPIHPDISRLTGIDESTLLEKAVPITQMATELSDVLKSVPACFVNPVVWGPGDAERLLALISTVPGISFPHLGRRAIDVKTWHTLISLSRGKNPSGGLKSVMAKYGLSFKGAAHRAEVDAFNTLRLFFLLLDRQSTLEGMAKLGKGVTGG